MTTLERLASQRHGGRANRPVMLLCTGAILCCATWFFSAKLARNEDIKKPTIEQRIAMHDYAGPEIDLSSIQKYKRTITSENFIYECFKAEGLSDEAIKQFSEQYKKELDKMNKELNISGLQSDEEKAIAIARYVAKNSPKVEEWYNEDEYRLSVWIVRKKGNCVSSSADLGGRFCANGIKYGIGLIGKHLCTQINGTYIDLAQTYIHPTAQYPLRTFSKKRLEIIKTCGPEDIVAAIYHSRAAVDEANNKFDMAIENIKMAIATCPEDDLAYCHMGILLAKKQRYSEAETWFLKSLRMNRFGALNHLKYGEFLRARGLNERGEEEIKLARNLAWEYDLAVQLCKELSQVDRR